MPAVSVSGLVRSYGSVRAVDGVSFEVRAGEVFALLGPNGAGKTTTIEILEGFRDREAGEVRVLGSIRVIAVPGGGCVASSGSSCRSLRWSPFCRYARCLSATPAITRRHGRWVR